jgi:catechol 2,3-dioxygenase-like lactoylglutathione lyase family enzyme
VAIRGGVPIAGAPLDGVVSQTPDAAHVELYVRDLERSITFWTPFMDLLGVAEDRWSEGVNYVAGERDAYVCLVRAPAEHLEAGYHRRRVGLAQLAFRARSRAQVDEMRAWVADAGFSLLYDERFPFATAPGYYAVFCEDPDRIKVEVVAPRES